jgi:hypothetical protein
MRCAPRTAGDEIMCQEWKHNRRWLVSLLIACCFPLAVFSQSPVDRGPPQGVVREEPLRELLSAVPLQAARHHAQNGLCRRRNGAGRLDRMPQRTGGQTPGLQRVPGGDRDLAGVLSLAVTPAHQHRAGRPRRAAADSRRHGIQPAPHETITGQ